MKVDTLVGRETKEQAKRSSKRISRSYEENSEAENMRVVLALFL